MNNLRAHLLQIASIPREESDRRMLREAVFVAAEATMSRLRELNGGAYGFTEAVDNVEKELRDDGSRAAKVPQKISPAVEPAAPMPSAESEML